MASVTRESLNNLHEKISVTVSQEDYLNKVNDTFKQLRKTVNMPGFRKGNVPMNMVQKMYGPSVFVDEVIKTVNKELDDYIREQELRIFGQPLAIEPEKPLDLNFKNPSEYTFDFEVGLVPDFSIKAIDEKAELTKYDIEITEELLDEEVENIRKRAGKFEDKESLEEETDVAYIDYFKEGEEKEDGKPTHEDVVELKGLPEALQKELKGQKAGYETTIVPADLIKDEKELNSFMISALGQKTEDEEAKKATYKLVLHRTASLQISEMNEEFFEQVFPMNEIKDEEGFRARLKEEIQKEADRLVRDQVNNQIYDVLINTTTFEFPETFLKKWLSENREEGKTDEELEADYPKFLNDIKWSLISDKLINQYEVQVSREEVENKVRMNALQYYGIQGADAAPWMDGLIDNMLKDQNMMDQTFRQIMVDKMFDKASEDLTLVPKSVSMEEFTDIVNKANEAGASA